MASLFASLGPRARKLVRYVGLGVLALVSFVFALQATFPYDRVKDTVVQLLSEKGYDAQIGDVERGILPARVYFKAVTVRTRPTKAGEVATTFYMEQLELDLGLLPLLHSAVALKFDAKIGQGHLKGKLALSKDGTSVHVTGDDLPSANLPVREALGLPMSGKVRLAFNLELPNDKPKSDSKSEPRPTKIVPNWPKAEGNVEFACPSGCTVGDGKSKLKLTTNNARQQEFLDQGGGGIDFGKVSVDSLLAAVEIKNGKLEITRFELKSPDGEAHIVFNLALNQDFMASTVTGCLRFHGSDALRKREPKTDAALSTTGAPLGPDNLFHIKLDGALRTMRRIGVLCGSGAGSETPGNPPPRPNLTTSPDGGKPPGLGSVGFPTPPAQPPVQPPAPAVVQPPTPPPAAAPQGTGGDAAHPPIEGPPPVVFPSNGSSGVPGAGTQGAPTGSSSPPAAPPGAPQ